MGGGGAAIGPLLSGFVLEHWDWNAVFAVNLPFIVAALVLGAFLVPRSRGEHGTPLDLPGAILSAVGLSVVVYAIIEGPIHGWLSATTLGVGAAGLATLAAFVLWELRIEHPMLDGLSRQAFSEGMYAALPGGLDAGPEESEALAVSFGL